MGSPASSRPAHRRQAKRAKSGLPKFRIITMTFAASIFPAPSPWPRSYPVGRGFARYVKRQHRTLVGCGHAHTHQQIIIMHRHATDRREPQLQKRQWSRWARLETSVVRDELVGRQRWCCRKV